jgi:hypothetical protein
MEVQSSGYAHTPGMDPRTYHQEKRQAEALKNLCLTAKNFVSYSILKVSNNSQPCAPLFLRNGLMTLFVQESAT